MTNSPLAIIEKYTQSIPVSVYDILRELGIGPELRVLSDNISGWIERTSTGRYHVVINDTHPVTRKRFTAAHELGHYIYHRDILGDGVGDNRAYRSAGTDLDNPKILPVHERQANSFAANVLMPRAHIDRLRMEGIEATSELAARFLVSPDAMRIRLGR